MNILKSVILVMFFSSLLSSCGDKVYECVCTYNMWEGSLQGGVYQVAYDFVLMEPTSLTKSEAKAEEEICNRAVGNETGDYGFLPNGSKPITDCSFNKL